MASLQDLTVALTSTFSGDVTIVGGTINGTSIGNNVAQRSTIGATTIDGTTITASTKFIGDLEGDITATAISATGAGGFGSISTTGAAVIGTNLTATGGTSTFSLVDINGGNIDGTAIGVDAGNRQSIGATTIDGTTITASLGFTGNITGPSTGTVGTSTLNNLDLNGNLTLSSGSLLFGATTVIDSSRNATVNDLVVNGSFAPNALTVTTTGNFGGNLTVGGDLTVNGTTTTINTETIALADSVIELNSDLDGGTAPSTNAGISINRGSETDVTFVWDEANDYWTFGSNDVVAANFIGNVSGNITGDITGDVTGNADTATRLETTRTIELSGDVVGSVSFDGAADVNIAAVIQANSVALGTDTVGQFASTVEVTGNGLSATSPNASDGTAYTITSNATPANTQSTLVFRDSSGDFAASSITANTFIGNINSTAGNDTLASLTVGGTLAVTGTTTFNNAVTVATGVAFNSDTVGITGGTILNTPIGNLTGGAQPIVGTTIQATGGFTGNLAGNVTGNVTGNADTADGLSSAVTVDLTGPVTGTATFQDGGDTATVATTIENNTVTLGTQTVGQYASTVAVSGVGLSINAPSADDGTAYIITSNATASNNQDTIVSRDFNGDFNAGTITADLVGAVTGDVEGNISTTLGTSNLNNLNVTGTGTIDTVSIGGGDIDGTRIGNSTPAAGNFTTISATGNISALAGVTGNLAGNVTAVSGTSQFSTLNVTGDMSATSGTTTLNDLVVQGNLDFTDLSISGSLTIGANLTVAGDVNIADPFIILNSDVDNATAATEDVGFTVNRGSDNDVSFYWDESENRWTTGSESLSVGGTIFGNLDGAIGTGIASTGSFTTVTTSGNLTVGNNLTVAGDLEVQGSVTTVSTEQIDLADNIIRVNSNATAGATGGIEVWRGGDGVRSFLWNEGAGRWSTETADLQFGTAYGDFEGNVTVGAGQNIDVSAATLTLANDQISGDAINGGTIGTVTVSNLTSSNATITGGSIDSTPIGGTTPALITGTTITADTQFVGDLDGNVSGNLTGNVTSTGTSTFNIAQFNAGVTFSGDIQGENGTTATFDDLVVTGTTNLQVFQIGDFNASGTVTFDEPFVTVNKGATGVDTANAGIEVERGDSPNVQLFWDGTNTRWSVDAQDFEAEKFIGDIVSTGTNSSFNTVDINGGTIDNTVIGASTRAAGNFTEIDANAGITGSFDGPVTSSSVTITGGTINSTQIGNTSPSSGNFTTVTASGNITTATGEVTADIITATGSLVGDLTGTVSSISNHTTADLAEDPAATATSGTQYFTTTRVDAHLSGGTGVTYTNGTISIGQPVATTDNVTFNDVNVDGDLTVVGAIDVPNLTVTGDLTVNGNTTTLNTETIELEDSIITLSNGYVGSTPSANAGININRGGGSAVDVQLLWNETTDKWEAIGGAFVSNSGFEGNIIGNVTGNVTATGGTSSFNSVDIDGGSIDGTAIGQNNPSTGIFQSVTASGEISAQTFDGNLTGNVTGTVSSIANHTTDALAEGTTRLYYTDARVNAHLSGANSVTYTNGVISIPQAIETTSDVTFNNVTVDGLLTAPNYAFTNIDASGNVTVGGDLTVSGATTTFNSAVEISTNEIVLLSAYSGSAPTSNAAIIVKRDQAPGGNAKLEWDENNDRWDIGSGATFRAGILLGNLTGDVTSNSTSTFADIDINAGSIDGVVIGAGSPGLITGTIITADTRFDGPITGDVTGNVSGDVTGDITSSGTSTFADIDVNGGNIDGTDIGLASPAVGNFTGVTASGTINANSGVVGNLQGNVTGNVTGDLTGNVTATSGTSTFDNLTVTGTLQAPAQSITDLIVSGNLTVNGTTTTINSETIELADNIIVLNSDKTGAAGSETAGIRVNRGDDTPVDFKWDDATDRWTVGSGTLEAGTFLGSLIGSVTGSVTGNVTGNITSTGNSSFANAIISGGTINDTDIGGVNPSVGSFTELDANSIVANTITANTEFSGTFVGDGSNLTGITTTQITEGSKLFFTNGRVQSALGSISIDALSDIDITSSAPSNGNTLVWNSAISKFVPAENFLQSDFDTAIGNTSIDDLVDVDTSSIPPSNGDTLVYNSTSSKWQPSTGQTSFSVTASGTSAWLFSGQGTDSDANPDLYLLPGKTYTFDIDATGTSFYINTSNTTGTGSAFNDGVTNNGTDSGVITFTVPQDAPSELFYNAENQAAMNGKIFVLKGTLNNVENPVFTSVKSSAYYDSQDRQLVIKDSSGNVIWGN